MLTGIALSACSMAPGIHIDPDLAKDDDDKVIEFEVRRISEKVVEELDARRSSQESLAGLVDASDYVYRVGKGDVLLITVFEHPELTMPGGPNTHPATSGTVVKDDGKIFFPYVGNVQAAGRTVESIREEITRKVAPFVNRPQLDVRVVEHRSQRVVVSGEVRQPGVMPLTRVPMSIVDAIQLAGGLTPMANEREILLTRANRVYRINLTDLYQSGMNAGDLRLQEGDSLYVTDRADEKVFVMGEVMQPQPVQIQKHGLSLTEALGEVGGLNNNFADARGVFVIRENTDAEVQTIYQLDASEPYALVLADRFELQAKDVVYVTASDVTRWNRVISQLLSSASLVKISSDVNN